ncbi:Dienelactone hydrolase family protein [hydrothermal vent metagenome]|uniref:Dienelactone hydrolase family protein n=1 Tax=hydrothermal vent metagenome TaxID=652676 RepID=A0A3B0X339_9ZZZZ
MKKIILPVLFNLLIVSVVQAKVITTEVKYSEADQEFTSFISYDDSIKGKRPGILVVHEWWGLSSYEKHRAEMLAKLGYVAIAVDMYGSGKLTDKPDQAKAWMQAVTTDIEWWRERAMMGIEQLEKHKLVDKNKLAAIGYCFGGGTVIQLAYGGADLKGIVSFHGALPIADKENFGKIKAKMLMAHGNADPFIRRESLTKFQDTLDKAKANWNMITYGNARHSFTNPESDSHAMDALKYDKYADEHSWKAMQVFLDEIFEQ